MWAVHLYVVEAAISFYIKYSFYYYNLSFRLFSPSLIMHILNYPLDILSHLHKILVKDVFMLLHLPVHPSP